MCSDCYEAAASLEHGEVFMRFNQEQPKLLLGREYDKLVGLSHLCEAITAL